MFNPVLVPVQDAENPDSITVHQIEDQMGTDGMNSYRDGQTSLHVCNFRHVLNGFQGAANAFPVCLGCRAAKPARAVTGNLDQVPPRPRRQF